MTHDLLLEIGCEEIPASFVAGALAALPDLVCKRLDAARLTHGAAHTYGSPRRIAILVESVAIEQPDVREEVVGPPATAAFDASGNPTKGGEAFAKKVGVPTSELRIVETPKGKYVAATREEVGRRAIELLPKILTEAIAAIPFRKSMRWGTSDVAFGRPIHWIVALAGNEVVALHYANVASGRMTRGHRFLSPGAIAIDAPKSYVSQLQAAHVLVDVQERKATMLTRLHEQAKKLGGVLEPDDFLVDENAGLVEEPFIVDGGFDAAFLALPEQLVLDVMRTHQRYFGVRDGHGALMPKYLAVVNTARAPETIARGNDRVMRARLSDARFFVESDRKAGLPHYAKKLAGIRYHAKLGSVADKVARMAVAACAIEEKSHASGTTTALLQEAAALCKADLASLTVGEFPEMQGYAGRDIALAAKVDARVADAIAEHWLLPETLATTGATGLIIGLADKLDHLVGGFSVGLAPTGAQDPFSMRRALNRAIVAYLSALSRGVGGKLPSLMMLCAIAYEAYALAGTSLPKPWSELEPELRAFIKTRLVGLFDEAIDAGGNAEALAGFRAPRDVVEACIEAAPRAGQATAFDDLGDLRARIVAVRDARGTDAIRLLSTAFKRAAKITVDVTPGEPDPSRFDHAAEKALWGAFVEARDVIERATASGDYGAAVAAMSKALAAPIDTFFDRDRGVFVMADDLAVRENRLRMLATIVTTLRTVARLELLDG